MYIEVNDKKYCPYCGQEVIGEICNCSDAIAEKSVDDEIASWEAQISSINNRIAELKASYPQKKYGTSTITKVVSIVGSGESMVEEEEDL